MFPAPEHSKQLPSFTLKENLPGEKPFMRDSGNDAKISLIVLKIPVYVEGLDLGVLPIGDWLISVSYTHLTLPTKA